MMLNAVTGNLPQSAVTGNRVFISHGLPKTLLESIQRWEFVDLVELLPAPSVHDALANTSARFTLFPGCELVRPNRRQIESITDFVKAFTVFMAAVLQKYPAQTSELLAYQLKAAQQYDGLQWRAYDTHFRVSAAATENKSWPKLSVHQICHGESQGGCYMLTVQQHSVFSNQLPVRGSHQVTYHGRSCGDNGTRTSVHSIMLPVSAKGANLSTFLENVQDPTPQSYAPGQCQGCKFKHICGECAGSHTAKLCSFTPKP